MATSSDGMKQAIGAFDNHAEIYEKLASGTSSQLAAAALARLPLSSYTSESHILDSACGPGIVTNLLLGAAPPGVSVPAGLPLNPRPRVTGIDLAPGMVAHYVAKSYILGWETASGFVQDASDLSPFSDAEFDAVVMNLGLFTLPDPVRGAAEIYRVLKPGGVCIVTVWKHTGSNVLLRKVMDAIRPDTSHRSSAIDPIWETEGHAASVLKAGGFEEENIETFAHDGNWQVDTVEDIVEFMSSPFWTERMCQGWTDEEKGRWRSEIMNQLSEDEKRTASVSMVAWINVAKK
jgi:ubiquinone/menaquinone biosynthesis C-methylase UbiE